MLINLGTVSFWVMMLKPLRQAFNFVCIYIYFYVIYVICLICFGTFGSNVIVLLF